MTAITQTIPNALIGAIHPAPSPPRPVRPAHVIDVSRPAVAWRWTSVLLAPLELLILAWSIPLVMLLVMAPVALTIAAALWAVRQLVGQ